MAAPPVDDAANQELILFLSQALGLSRSALRVPSGRSGRRKQIAVEGLSAQALQERVAALTAIPRRR